VGVGVPGIDMGLQPSRLEMEHFPVLMKSKGVRGPDSAKQPSKRFCRMWRT
jgi:hypothetical protein